MGGFGNITVSRSRELKKDPFFQITTQKPPRDGLQEYPWWFVPELEKTSLLSCFDPETMISTSSLLSRLCFATASSARLGGRLKPGTWALWL